MTPDTTSPIFPDRPIRPLPKRPLRSRLSQEAADSIKYPPAPNTSDPVFYFPFENGDTANEAKVHVQQNLNGYHSGNCEEYEHDGAAYDDGADSYDDESPVMVRRPAGFRAGGSHSRPDSASQSRNRTQSQNHTDNNTFLRSSPPGPDGYDAFENTNNKKKRKIPTSGAVHSASLSTDIHTMGNLCSRDDVDWAVADDGAGVGQYYGSGNPATPANLINSALSGSGRGRYARSAGRSVGGRSPLPLGVSTNGSNAWMNGRSGKNEVTSEHHTLKGQPMGGVRLREG